MATMQLSTMQLSRDHTRPTLQMLASLIAQSPIAVAPEPASRLPLGYDAVDVAVLDWIAAEGRRLGRSFVRM